MCVIYDIKEVLFAAEGHAEPFFLLLQPSRSRSWNTGSSPGRSGACRRPRSGSCQGSQGSVVIDHVQVPRSSIAVDLTSNVLHRKSTLGRVFIISRVRAHQDHVGHWLDDIQRFAQVGTKLVHALRQGCVAAPVSAVAASCGRNGDKRGKLRPKTQMAYADLT